MGANLWALLGLGLDLGGAIAVATLAIWLMPRRDRFGNVGGPIVVALFLTAGWCLAVASSAFTVSAPRLVLAPSLAESARNLGWLLVIHRLFVSDGRDASLAPIRPVILALAFVELLHLAVDLTLSSIVFDKNTTRVVFEFNVMFRLLVTVGGLVLVHNLYAGASRDTRRGLRWPASGLAMLWAFDLNLYTIAYLAGYWPVEIAAFRGLATLVLAGAFGLAVARNRDELRIRPSRAVTFQTFSLLVIGAYLLSLIHI